MPAKASELAKAARQLGFEKTRQKDSHARWKHPDDRSTTIPIHGKSEIGGWLFYEMLDQLWDHRSGVRGTSIASMLQAAGQNERGWRAFCFPAHSPFPLRLDGLQHL